MARSTSSKLGLAIILATGLASMIGTMFAAGRNQPQNPEQEWDPNYNPNADEESEDNGDNENYGFYDPDESDTDADLKWLRRFEK